MSTPLAEFSLFNIVQCSRNNVIDDLRRSLSQLESCGGQLGARCIWRAGLPPCPSSAPTPCTQYQTTLAGASPHHSKLRECQSFIVSLKSQRELLFDLLQSLDDALVELKKEYLPLILEEGIRRLPDELVARIFELGSQGEVGRKAPMSALKVSQVCRRFRNIALDTPGLWANLSVAHPQLTRVFLERSKSAPLYLRTFSGIWEAFRPEDIARLTGITDMNAQYSGYCSQETIPYCNIPMLTEYSGFLDFFDDFPSWPGTLTHCYIMGGGYSAQDLVDVLIELPLLEVLGLDMERLSGSYHRARCNNLDDFLPRLRHLEAQWVYNSACCALVATLMEWTALQSVKANLKGYYIPLEKREDDCSLEDFQRRLGGIKKVHIIGPIGDAYEALRLPQNAETLVIECARIDGDFVPYHAYPRTHPLRHLTMRHCRHEMLLKFIDDLCDESYLPSFENLLMITSNPGNEFLMRQIKRRMGKRFDFVIEESGEGVYAHGVSCDQT